MNPDLSAHELDAARRALAGGRLDDAVASLDGCAGTEAAALWLRAGAWARFSGASARARECFARAAEADPGFAAYALAALADVAAEEGKHREEAKARAAAFRAQGEIADPLARAAGCATVGFAFLRGRRAEDARRWLAEAVEAHPDRWDARAALVRMAGEDQQSAAVERWIATAPPLPPRATAWWMARGEAARALGQLDEAERCFEAALDGDPEARDPAEALVELGVEAGRDATLDAALRALQARALAEGDLQTGFLAAAALVGRSTGEREAQRTYRQLRGALTFRPRGGLPRGWIATWLGVPLTGEPTPLEAAPAGEAHALSVLPEVAAWFGLSGVRAELGADWGLLREDPPTVAVPTGAAARGARFHLGRLCAALAEPRLRVAFGSGPEATAAVRALDRCGLVSVQDPAVALRAVVDDPARGRALAGFCVSHSYRGLLEVLGVGVRSPLPSAPGTR